MKKLIRLLSVFLLLPVCSIVSFAQPRSEGEALEIAQKYLSQQPTVLRNRVQSSIMQQLRLTLVPQQAVEMTIGRRASIDSAQEPAFYIVNDEQRGRFVIVSGDSRQTDVLGYSDAGIFDADDVPCGLEALLAQYGREFDFLQKNAQMVDAQQSRRAPTVNPLVSTEWDQGNNDPSWVGEYVYNRFCPTSGSKRCVTGCVATAMAQILYMHKQPGSLPNKTIKYATESNGFSLSENLSNFPLNWDKMLPKYRDASSTKVQRDAVGYLMYACGLSVHMDYRVGGSGSSTNNVPYALYQYFGYNANMKYCERDYYSSSEWNGMIQDELQAGRPVLYGGNNPNTGSGHVFIIDGCYSDGKYHINWGWGGKDNGAFALSTLDASNYYVSGQEMVIGITKNTIGSRTEQFFAESFVISPTTITIGSTAAGKIADPTCQCAPVATTGNYDDTQWSGYTGIAVFDADFKLLKEFPWRSDARNYDMGMSRFDANDIQNVNVKFDAGIFKDGKQYYIAPYARGANSSSATRMRTKNGASDYYLATVTGNTVTLTLMGTASGGGGDNPGGGDTDIRVTEVYVEPFSLTMNPGDTKQLATKITPETATNKSLNWTSTNTSVATVNSAGIVTAKSAGEATITCTTKDGSNLSLSIPVQVLSSGLPNVRVISTTSGNSSLNGMKIGDKLYVHATFENTGTPAKVYTQVRIRNAETQEILYKGNRELKQFPTSSSFGFDYQCEIPSLPDGAYQVYVAYFDNWEEYSWYRNNNCMIDFTIGTGKAPYVVISSTAINSPLNLTQSDQLSLTTKYENSGGTIDKFETAIVFIDANGKWFDKYVDEVFPFEANSNITLTKKLWLWDVPAGSYKVAIMYFDYWGRDSWIYKDESALYNITISSSTPVEAIHSDNGDEESAPYYDLKGQRIEKPKAKGVYIRNGKKVIIK